MEGAKRPSKPNETVLMLVVLGLIDVVMISNLLIMVIVGGYETFVSRMAWSRIPDQPEWLSHVNASVLKVARHRDHRHLLDPPLKTFINAASYENDDHCAGRHPHHFPAVGDRHRRRGPRHARRPQP